MTKPASGGIRGFFRRTWTYIVVMSIATKFIIKEMFTRHRKLNLQVTPKKTGQTAVITGGARGLGAEVVKQLMVLDMHCIIACRKEAAGVKLIDTLRKAGIQSGSAEVLELDLNSFASVRAFAEKLLNRNIPINLLVNNAGIMFVPYQITEDGFESQLQTNYLSHFLLTNLLMPLLTEAGTQYRVSRVVNVSSIANLGGKINFEDLNMERMYDPYMAYAASKLMQVVSAKDLNARLKAEGQYVRFYSLHPGVIFTELYSHMWYVKPFLCILKRITKSPEQGADGIVFVAASSETETEGGEYFANCKKAEPNALVRDPSVQQRLWSTSLLSVGLKSPGGTGNKEQIEIVPLT